MGGKRPDQYQIDPAESGATDYKNLPQTGRGHSNLDDTVELDKQRHARSAEEAEHPPRPRQKPAPSQDANRALQADEHRASGREEFGSGSDSQRHPPHVPAHDRDAPLQDEHPSPRDVPVLPANAAGTDKLTPDEQHETIDDESMYDGRPERDKDNPPSERG